MSSSLLVAENLLFDSRLALFHQADRWLAIADLHYGYELSQQAAGGLFPNWGMAQIEAKVASLLADYQPQTVLFLGDLIHDAAAAPAFLRWAQSLQTTVPELILIRGNHDRQLKNVPLHDQWRIRSSVFHHGDREISPEPGEIVFSGHLHPAESLFDGAGLHQKFPALLKIANHWVLPAFSPWAVGGYPRALMVEKRWVAASKKVWKIADFEPAKPISV